jgi:hypothetical protein
VRNLFYRTIFKYNCKNTQFTAKSKNDQSLHFKGEIESIERGIGCTTSATGGEE